MSESKETKLILPDKEKVLAALAYCWKLDLEEQTGREVIVTWESIPEEDH